jgi:NAD+ kinase
LKFKKWGLICKPDSFKFGEEVYHFLEREEKVSAEKKLANYLSIEGFSIEEIGKSADAVVTIGGDGTILMALEHVNGPIFPINTGAVGFLTEVDEKDGINGLEKVIEGDYWIEERMKIKTILDGNRCPDGLNEVTIQTASIGKILPFQLSIDNEVMKELQADGIIIATPTGSTSYALSVGGPILDPLIDALVIVSIAPFRYFHPLVVPSKKDISINLTTDKGARMAIDGMHARSITRDNDVHITASEKKAKFIRLKSKGFYYKLHERLKR